MMESASLEGCSKTISAVKMDSSNLEGCSKKIWTIMTSIIKNYYIIFNKKLPCTKVKGLVIIVTLTST